jgi:predicted porin
LFVGDNEVDKVNDKSELFAPLPNVRFYGFYALSPKWHVSATAGWLSLEYDSWTGDYSFLNVRTEYQFSKRFGVGVGYQITLVDLKRDTDTKLDEYNFDLTGPTLYFSYAI